MSYSYDPYEEEEDIYAMTKVPDNRIENGNPQIVNYGKLKDGREFAIVSDCQYYENFASLQQMKKLRDALNVSIQLGDEFFLNIIRRSIERNIKEQELAKQK